MNLGRTTAAWAPEGCEGVRVVRPVRPKKGRAEARRRTVAYLIFMTKGLFVCSG